MKPILPLAVFAALVTLFSCGGKAASDSSG
jgi:hypothetical protein